MCNAWSVKTGIMSTILNTPFSVTAFIGAAAIFLLLRDGVSGRKQEELSGNLAGLTLGIYLIHPLFLRIYGWLGGTTLFAPAAIAVPLIVVLITLISGAAVYVLSKIPVVKKIVGR